jgi:hypothetical protein
MQHKQKRRKEMYEMNIGSGHGLEEKYFVYDLFDYDVLGNKKDGFEVNDIYHVESGIVLAESVVLDDKKLIRALKKLGIVKKGVHAKSLYIDGEPDATLYFDDVRMEVGGFCPAFELRCTSEIG